MMEEKKKVYWNEVANGMNKTSSGCQKAAKDNNIQVFP